MRPAQQFGEDHAGLRVSIIVGLQTGEDQVELFVLDRCGEGLRGVERVQPNELVVFEVNGTVRSLGKRFAQDLLCASRAAGDDDDLAVMLFPLAQGLFEGVGVRLVDFVRDVFANPRAAFV